MGLRNTLYLIKSMIFLAPLIPCLLCASFISFKTYAQNPIIDLSGTHLIYGADDRHEIDDFDDSSFQDKAKSVAMKISNRRLNETDVNSNFIEFFDRKLRQRIQNLCPAERFYEQSSIGDCSGFLVGEKTLITAGHCMSTLSECKNSRWVFDYKLGTTQFSRENVYKCNSILEQKKSYTKNEISDYAVIELDRPVSGRVPLEIRKYGRVSIGTPLVVIGHPLGLPMKITDGARVTGMNDIEKAHPIRSFFLRNHYFTANLDTYVGGSGSPVFNRETGKVEGIVIQGADDFSLNEEKYCLESHRLSNARVNSYEKVMRINKIPIRW